MRKLFARLFKQGKPNDSPQPNKVFIDYEVSCHPLRNKYNEKIARKFLDSQIGREVIKSHVNEIIFADSNFYNSTVKRIKANERLTNNENYKGIAKTLFLNEEQRSSIVYDSEIIEQVARHCGNSRKLQNWCPHCLEMGFILFHEVGHSIDYKKSQFVERKRFSRFHHLFQVHEHYIGILIEEIRANSFASSLIPFEHNSTIRNKYSLNTEIQGAFDEAGFSSFRNPTEEDEIGLTQKIYLILLGLQHVTTFRLAHKKFDIGFLNPLIKGEIYEKFEHLSFQVAERNLTRQETEMEFKNVCELIRAKLLR